LRNYAVAIQEKYVLRIRALYTLVVSLREANIGLIVDYRVAGVGFLPFLQHCLTTIVGIIVNDHDLCSLAFESEQALSRQFFSVEAHNYSSNTMAGLVKVDVSDAPGSK
jgi:hypothetical protein